MNVFDIGAVADGELDMNLTRGPAFFAGSGM